MHHQHAGAAGDRRLDRRVLELDGGVLDGRPIGADRRLERRRGRAGRVDLLARGDAALGELLGALRLGGGIRELRLVPRERGFSLLQRRFERTSIEREQDLPLRDVVAFLEVDRGELAGDLRADGHAGRSLDGANRAELERHRLADDLRERHRNRRCAAGARRASRAFRPTRFTAPRTDQRDNQSANRNKATHEETDPVK